MASRVVVLGGGYAGLLVAHRLERDLPESAELQLIDETGTHLIQHELHRVIRRPDLADELTIPLTSLLERATIITATVAGIEYADHRIRFDDRDPMPYDVGVVCLGATPAFDGLPGVEEHGTPLKRLAHAEAIRSEFQGVLNADGRAVVAGAGLSGVQVAGELAAFAREEGSNADVILLEREPTVTPGFPREFRIAVRRELETRGVEVRTDCRVAEATDDAVRLATGELISTDQLVWTGGIRGPDATGRERPEVRATLEHPDDPSGRTFALGDAVQIIDSEGARVPATAQAATRAAGTAARNVCSVLAGGDRGFDPRLEQFTFDSSGWLVSVGDGAVARIGPTVFTGAAAKALKSSVGAGYLASAGSIREAVSLVREEFRPAEQNVGEFPRAEAGRRDIETGE